MRVANSSFTLQVIKNETLRSESTCLEPDFELIAIPSPLLIFAATVLASKNAMTPATVLYVLSYTL